MANTNKKYEPEFKRKIARLYLEGGRTIESINKEYHLGDGTMRIWARKYQEECADSPTQKEELDTLAEIRRLKKELEDNGIRVNLVSAGC
ncbi:transposase [Lachnospiraceae bacterium JLR.KK008]